jgi:hypothetical protein
MVRADDWRATEAAYTEARLQSLDLFLTSLDELADEFPEDKALGSAARALAACCRAQANDLAQRSLQLRAALREREHEALASRRADR